MSGHSRTCRRRKGLSLIEVLLALSVFGVGAAALLHCVDGAQRSGARAHFLNEAVIRSTQIHGQLEAAVVASSQTSREAFADDPRWTWSVDETPQVEGSLVRRTVTVRFGVNSGEQAYSLTRIAARKTSTRETRDDLRGSP